jgi:hypothetical protein
MAAEVTVHADLAGHEYDVLSFELFAKLCGQIA